jgi:hypothetical protein
LRSAAKQIASTSARSRGSSIFGSAAASSLFSERPCNTAWSTSAAVTRAATPVREFIVIVLRCRSATRCVSHVEA